MLTQETEDALLWNQARALAQKISSSSQIPAGLRSDKRLWGQLQSAAVSIMFNIEDGLAGRTSGKPTDSLSVARRYAIELQSLLCIATDHDAMEEEDYSEMHAQAADVARTISGRLNKELLSAESLSY